MRLSEAIERYLRVKRANGLAYETEGNILSSFERCVSDLLIEEIAPKHVAEFLNLRQCSDSRWMTKHSCLRIFFEFWTDRGQMSPLSMPRSKRRSIDRLAKPFIYTRTQVRNLIQATQGNQTHGNCTVSETTFRTLLLALYGTGAMIPEIACLRREDLDLKSNLIFLRGDRIIQPRRVPFSKDLHELLITYLHSEERRRTSGPNIFVTSRGTPLPAHQLIYSFKRLRTRAGILRVDSGMRKPRMCDLRPTFAVHRIACWIKEGADLNRMLPALSAYMGYAGFDATQRFLLMTPERFGPELDALSPYKTRKHWRDDPELMRFLSNL
jgi:integrase/recombinase XerD